MGSGILPMKLTLNISYLSFCHLFCIWKFLDKQVISANLHNVDFSFPNNYVTTKIYISVVEVFCGHRASKLRRHHQRKQAATEEYFIITSA